MAGLESGEAHDLLRRAIGREEQLSIRKAELAAFATDILRRKGELGLVRRGIYGGRLHKTDSGRVGARMTQATMPVRIGTRRNHVALRDHEREYPVIELISVTDGRAVGVRNAGPQEVLVSFAGNSLQLRGVQRVESRHLKAIGVLLETIDNHLDPLPGRPRDILPHVYFRNDYKDGQIIELRGEPSVTPAADGMIG
jgi:hypothetical protein